MSEKETAPEAPLSAYENISIEKAHDIIPVSVGLYGMFLANGKEGLYALMVYQHLIYTARLQETNQVWANNVYISNALPLGQESIRKAKAFLHRKGLIKYVQTRDSSGHMEKSYIRICFISPSALGAGDGGDTPAPEETDSTGGMITRSPDEPETQNTAYTKTAPPADRCTGAERQMLEVRNEMLEVRNEIPISCENENCGSETEADPVPQPEITPKRFSYNPNDTASGAKSIGTYICTAWYSRYQKETARLQNPGPADISAAISLVYQFPELKDSDALALSAIEKHFDLWKCAWYLTTEQTRKLPDEHKKPSWTFTNFCRFFAQIIDLEKADPGLTADNAGTGGGQRAGQKKGVTPEERDAIVDQVMAKYQAGGAV